MQQVLAIGREVSERKGGERGEERRCRERMKIRNGTRKWK